jgi:hypothetical protein
VVGAIAKQPREARGRKEKKKAWPEEGNTRQQATAWVVGGEKVLR